MPTLCCTLFDTAIGSCGLVWGADGIAGVQLPEASERATRQRQRRRYPDAHEAEPPEHIRQVVEAIMALLAGERCDLSGAVLDMAGIQPFPRQVYAIARTIPAGGTLSYGEIADRLGDRSAAREVGEAMGANPFPLIVPCHRVLAAGGKLGGFSANGGVVTKLRLLEIERAQIGEAPTLFDSLPLSTRPRGR